MVKRKNFKDFQRDSPLTETGRSQARLTGEPVYVCLEKREGGGGGGVADGDGVIEEIERGMGEKLIDKLQFLY